MTETKNKKKRRDTKKVWKTTEEKFQVVFLEQVVFPLRFDPKKAKYPF